MSTLATHVWKPSAARTVTLDAFVPVPRGATPAPAVLPSWPLKDPADLLDYQFDIAPALIGNDGDAIATLDIAIAPSNPGDLALTATSADGTRAVLWLTGGQVGITYVVSLSIGTQAGRSLARSVLLPVAQLAVPASPTGGLTTGSGVSLTDQNGNPILAGP